MCSLQSSRRKHFLGYSNETEKWKSSTRLLAEKEQKMKSENFGRSEAA